MPDAAAETPVGDDEAAAAVDMVPAASRKRDNRYFERRLEREHPEIWAAWQAGAFPSLRAACIDAGLIRPRSRMTELTNAWRKATAEEKVAFLKFLHSADILRRLRPVDGVPREGESVPKAPRKERDPVKPTFPWRVAVNGYLTPEAETRILEIMRRRGLIDDRGYHVGVIMAELGRGFSNSDASLAYALRRGWSIQPKLIRALEKWLDKQSVRQG